MEDVKRQAALWASFWQDRALPILPASAHELTQIARRIDRVRPGEIADVVMRDPLLALQVLRFINQRERSQLAADVVSIEKTVMLMGVVPFLERFGRLPSLERLQPSPALLASIKNLIVEGQLLLRLSRDYAIQRYDARLDEVLMAAALANLNELLGLLAPLLDPSAPAKAASIGPLLARFGVPDTICGLLEVRGETLPRETLQHAVLHLVYQSRRGWWWPEVAQNLACVAGVLGQEPSLVWQTFCRHALAIAEQESLQHRDFPVARWLPMLPGEWPQPPKPRPVATAHTIEVDRLSRLMQALHLSGKNALPSNQVMALALRVLAEGLGMKRILFALHAPAEKVLKARFLQGVPDEDPLHDLVIKLDEPHLLTQLMQKSQGFWYNDETAPRFRSKLPATLLQHASPTSFCIMSIFVGPKAVGMIYADRHGADAISDDDYLHFKQICVLTGRALTPKPAAK